MVEAASIPVAELEAEPEAPVCERRVVDVEAKRALARRLRPAERRGVLLRGGEQESGLVPQLERDARRRNRLTRGDAELDGERLAGRELLPLLAAGPEQPRRVDPQPRRFRTRSGRPRSPPGRARRRAACGSGRSPPASSRRARRCPSRSSTARSQSRSTEAASCETKTIVPPRCLNSKIFAKHLRWNSSSPTAKTSSRSSDVGVDVRGDREAEPHVHPGRVGADGQVDEPLELGEGDDLVHALVDRLPLQAVERAVQVDVLAAREVGVEAGAELEQRRDAAAGLDAAGGRLDDPGDQAEERRLARAVAADQPDRLAGLDRERDVVERPDLGRLRARPREDQPPSACGRAAA